jgi:hypothetical protein
LRRRGGTVHGFSFVVLILLQAERGGSLRVVTVVVFVEIALVGEKAEDEIPMFARFVERGLALPASDFFKGLLGYYGIEYLNLNPNGIFHTAVIVHFCEAFLGIKPRWVLSGSSSASSRSQVPPTPG